MGLFTPNMNPMEKMQLHTLMKQAKETEKILNETTNPATFFSRLNFYLDVYLTMQNFEKFKIFNKGQTPSNALSLALGQMENSVNEFMDKAYRKEIEASYKLKTDKARAARIDKFFNDMFEIFEKCKDPHSDIRRGNPAMEHYSGILVTPHNEEFLLGLRRS